MTNPLIGQSVSINVFRKGVATNNLGYTKSSDRAHLVFKAVHMEEFQRGLLPVRVHVRDGARAGTILKIAGQRFTRLMSNHWIKKQHTTPTIVDVPRGSTHGAVLAYMVGNLSVPDPNVPYKLMLDDGTDVTNKISANATLEVELGCDLPTKMVFTKGNKAKVPAKLFTDRFDQVINVGDGVILSYHDKLFIATVRRYYPAGGMVLKTMDGEEIKLMTPYAHSVVKLDSKLPERIMIAKLSKL